MIMNRVADVFFILAILLILLKFKTANYLIVLDLVVFIKDDYLIFCGYYLNLVFLISFFSIYRCRWKISTDWFAYMIT